MLQGKKTWIGIVITLLGMVGLGSITTQDQITEVVDAVAKIVGIAITIYGNWDAHRRLEE